MLVPRPWVLMNFVSTITKIYELRLGEEVSIDHTLNSVAIADIRWESEHLMSCLDCITPIASPLNSGGAQVFVTIRRWMYQQPLAVHFSR